MKLISTTVAANISGVSKKTILVEIKAGRLPHKRIGSHYKTTAEWLDKWISTPTTRTITKQKSSKKNEFTIQSIIVQYEKN